MIAPRTSRDAILKKLRAKAAAKRPIWIASAGSGLVARLLEAAGADCINTFSGCLLYTSPSPRDGLLSRMPSSA